MSDVDVSKTLIMVVDDQPEVLGALRMMLEDEGGYQVMVATNGQHALERLEAALKRKRQVGESSQKFVPDLILSDIAMPVMDGYDFYEKTRANPYLNHIPFVFLTAMQTEEDVRRGKELGVDDYLLKPVQTADLLATVRGKLRRVSQQRALVTQTVGDLDRPPAAGVIFVIAVISVIVLITVIVTLMIVT
jgi:CheY-like chemotaxis protein